MKIIIGCLAVIGLLVVLMVGGCLGLAGLAMSSLPAIPPYATSANIESAFKNDLAIIKQYLEKNDATLLSQLSTDAYALYLDDEELLKRHPIKGKSHYMHNDAGVGTVRIDGRTVSCLTYELSKGEDDYVVYFLDKKAGEPIDKPVELESVK
jgi:hypothetical protein